MRGLLRTVRQIMAFARKEMADVAHQPRLLVTMVLGPFLVMGAFALGYKNTPPVMRAAFVAPEGSIFSEQLDTYADDMAQVVDLVAVTSDPAVAAHLLADDEVDVVVTFPDDPFGTVLDGEQAVVTVSHTRLDPIERTAIKFATALAVEQVNGRILSVVVGEGQQFAAPAQGAVEAASIALDTLAEAATSGDESAWSSALAETENVVADLDSSLRTSSTVAAELGSPAVRDALDAVRADLADLQDTTSPDGDTTALIDTMREDVQTVADRFVELTSVNPEVLVRPLAGDVTLAVPGIDRITDWYAPAAVVLMLQQFGIAFGALSFVRERQLGINEVFRVAPVGAAATVLGKYLAYLIIGGAIGAVLTAGVVLLLDVPLAGSIGDMAVAMGLLLAASIGLGLVISLVSASDAQAVQYTMIVLLASLFFSGFFLSIGQMAGVARVVSYLLPVTYGMEMLRDVMLRGSRLDPLPIALLGAYAVVALAVALVGARRMMSTGSAS